MPSQTIGNRYRVIGTLGRGGQGAVYRVEDLYEGGEVALKLLNPQGFGSGGWREAQALRQLSHDQFILPIRNAELISGVPVIVTEIAERGSVEGVIAATGNLGVPVLDAVRWTRQACFGLSIGHDRNLVHNDMKPGNLFLTAMGDCVVGDFGYAGQLSGGVAPVHGFTPATLAPEVAKAYLGGQMGTAGTIRSDVFSLAATAFWMLAGQPPIDFTAASSPVEMVQRATGPVRNLRDVAPHVPQPIAQVVMRGLRADPGGRPATAHELAGLLGISLPGRLWARTDEHPGHLACWRGSAQNQGLDLVMCMEIGSKASSRVITTRRDGNTPRRVNAGCDTATTATWPATVRRLMRAVT